LVASRSNRFGWQGRFESFPNFASAFSIESNELLLANVKGYQLVARILRINEGQANGYDLEWLARLVGHESESYRFVCRECRITAAPKEGWQFYQLSGNGDKVAMLDIFAR
jgi:hypothetical protein